MLAGQGRRRRGAARCPEGSEPTRVQRPAAQASGAGGRGLRARVGVSRPLDAREPRELQTQSLALGELEFCGRDAPLPRWVN